MPETQRQSTFRRILLLAAGLCVVALVVVFLCEPDTVDAQTGEDLGRTLPTLATVGGEPISEAEILERAAGELLRLRRERHELIERTVETRIRERLLEIEAARRDLPPEEMLRREIEARRAAIPAAEVEAFHEGRRLRQPFAQAEEQIRRHLASEAFYRELEEEHAVERRLEPFRIAMAPVGPSRGPSDAPVTLIEMVDFECPFCSRMVPVLDQLQRRYGDQVRFVVRQFPLEIHPSSPLAARASLCADDQGHFWEMHDRLFADQANLHLEGLPKIAAKVEGIDLEAFKSCLDSDRHEDALAVDRAAGLRAGVSGTPAFFINGRYLSGTVTADALAEIVEDELRRERSASADRDSEAGGR